jgi:hypothetical protein
MEKKVENYINSKVEEILTSPNYKSLSTEKKDVLKKKLDLHLKRMTIETFVNNLTEEDAQKLSNLVENDSSKVLNKINELAFSTPDLAEKLEKRINKEAEKFKSL